MSNATASIIQEKFTRTRSRSSIFNSTSKRSTCSSSKRKSVYLEDFSMIQDENSNFSNTQLPTQDDDLEDNHFFSETNDNTCAGAESDTWNFDKISIIKKKIAKNITNKFTKPNLKKQKAKFNTNFKIMRFQENTKELRKKTFRFYCFEEKDLNIKEEFLNLDIPQHNSDNDKQSDDGTIRHAIKHCHKSLLECIEKEKEIKKEEKMFSSSSSSSSSSSDDSSDDDDIEKDSKKQQKLNNNKFQSDNDDSDDDDELDLKLTITSRKKISKSQQQISKNKKKSKSCNIKSSSVSSK